MDTTTKNKDGTRIDDGRLDWNAVAGEGEEERYVGHYGLGIRKAHGKNW